MEKTLIFGHKSPDTDTICSAICYADLKNKLGVETEPKRLGAVNTETQFALDYFQADSPAFIDRVDDDITNVILVDHNEFQQSVDNIRDVHITEVIDHHRVANFETKEPLYFRVEPVGCTATILNKMYKEQNVKMSKQIAGLLLSAIISDSLLLKSPTCTKEDVDAANELAELAGVDLETYGMDMLEAGADLSDKTIQELLTVDAKAFVMNGSKVEIAQVNAIDTEAVFEKQADLEAGIKELLQSKQLDLFIFTVTDILNNNSEVLAIGKASGCLEKAFNVTLNNKRALLKGVVSRKKQIVPVLTDAFIKENTLN